MRLRRRQTVRSRLTLKSLSKRDMRKLILIALVILTGASFSAADAVNKKKKEQVQERKDCVAVPANASDSLSYAAGVVRTDGLMPFIKQQYGVDTAYMADFVRGYKDILGVENIEKAKAYAAGQQIALMVKQRMLPFLKDEFKTRPDSINDAMFHLGFISTLNKDSSVMPDSTAKAYFDMLFKQTIAERDAANRKAGEDFLAENKARPGVVTTASGLQYKVLTEGKGDIPTASDEVVVKYEGRLIDGTVFDSSYKRAGETAKFRPNQVIKGWTEALTMMPVGSKWELYIPQELAYGERQAGTIKPYSALIFTVEVVSIEGEKAKTGDAETKVKTGNVSRPMITPKKK